MKLVFISFFYSPDLCAGSFRATALVSALEKNLNDGDELHVITTIPNRYSSHKVIAQARETHGKVTIHRLNIPFHTNIKSQIKSFIYFAVRAIRLCASIKPDFLLNTNGRMMTGTLTSLLAVKHHCGYYIDIRDIFSETISDLFNEKNKLLGFIFKWIFSGVEKFVLKRADGVNVVSEAFIGYYDKLGLNTNNWDFFPNGIDDEFVNHNIPNKSKSVECVILYAGNIGKGQGLEKIIPDVAEILGMNFKFLIVGDGGTKHLLEKEINDRKIKNVILKPPVKRSELIQLYSTASILFLHLNNIPAFLRVLPSKIFEYAVMKKPIVAGLAGYSAEFLHKEVLQASVFSPGDADICASLIRKQAKDNSNIEMSNDFVTKYSRENIMDGLSESILCHFNK